MTALDDRPPVRYDASRADHWEWRQFEADGWAHLYRVAELRNPRLELLRPWCLLGQRFPLEHDRASIGLRPMLNRRRGCICPACAAHEWATIPHPRHGTLLVGRFIGALAEVVTRDARR